METYNTLSEAISDLKSKGYTEDFNVEHAYITHKKGGHSLFPNDFHVDDFFVLRIIPIHQTKPFCTPSLPKNFI
ncbi:MAG: hypothetical protein KGO81_05520 [Bacteroidota bacterium]|nr:hypothetical protein [Bacteroidota bacterium]